MTSAAKIRALAFGRVVVGSALLVAPRAAGERWIGPEAHSGAVTVLTRALGARDAFMGLMTLHTAGRPEVGPRWLRACAVIDAIDGAATFAARRELPAVAAGGAMIVAFSSAAKHAKLAAQT